LASLQAGSGVRPPSYSMVTVGPLREVKRRGRDAGRSPSSIARIKAGWSYNSTSPTPTWPVQRQINLWDICSSGILLTLRETRQSHFKAIGRPETSLADYRSQLRNIPEERKSHLYIGGSLRSHKFAFTFIPSAFFRGVGHSEGQAW